MDKFSHYTIEGKLGEGGMGEVHKALDPRLDRIVALKLLTDAFANDPERLARFEREARLLASLNHPNIASIHGLEEDHGKRALVLEYVDGDDLSVPIKNGPMSIEDALDAARQIAEALEYAHEQGVMHRDLKPANIKLMRDGTVKVLDFGLAKALDAGGPDAHGDPSISQSPTLMGTAHGVILGTAAYMSPEQARGKSVDKRADIWAFGCVLFEMLTGKQTFMGETISDTLAAILRADPEWQRLPPDVPDPVRAVLQRCLEKDPRRRLRDIGEARIIIEAVQSGAPISTVTGLQFADTSGVQTASGFTGAVPTRGAAPQTPGGRGGRRGLRALHWMLTIGFMAAWIVFMVLFLVERSQESEQTPIIRALITPQEGRDFSNVTFSAHAFHAVSPTGERITFISDNFLWVRALDQVNATRLPDTEGANFPFWSADGRSIGFFAGGKLRTVSADGGPVTTVCDAPMGRGGTWNADDVILFTPELRTGLYRVNASGGESRPVTQPTRPTHSTHRWPRFLPDGESFLYMAANHTNPKGAQTAIYVASLSDTVGKLLVAADSHPVYAAGYLLYTRDRNLMAHPFSAATRTLSGNPIRIAENCAHHGGSWVGCFDARGDVLTYQGDAPPIGSEVTWFSATGEKEGILGKRDLHWDVTFSPDGRYVAVARGNPEPSIYIHDLQGGVEQRLTVDGSFSRAPVWSSDGKRIIYSSIRENGRLNLYEVPSDRSSPPKPLLVDDVDMIATSWSPDGSELLVDYGEPGENEIWIVSVDGESEPRPYIQPPWVYAGRFSRDGKRVAFVTRQEGDTDHVVVTDYPNPRGRTRVVNGFSTGPRWDQTRDVLYLESSGITQVPFRFNGDEIRFGDPEVLFDFLNDSSLFVQSDNFYQPAPDGRFLCCAASSEKGSITALTLVVGWDRELK